MSDDKAKVKHWSAAVDVLQKADAGELPFSRGVRWSFCGVPTYKVEGWEFGIFDDCGEWDYLGWAQSPDGTRINGDDKDEEAVYHLWIYRPYRLLAEDYEDQVRNGESDDWCLLRPRDAG